MGRRSGSTSGSSSATSLSTRKSPAMTSRWRGCSKSSTTARMIRKSQTSWLTASNCASTQKASRTTYARSSWTLFRTTLKKVKI
uniref:Uncharacterized protein n=1 Tax=Arundo donax TaxID=35708 RepID=A0A0A9EY89_ARUDO